MKKLVLAYAALLFAFAAALAQTPEEIVSRMEAEMNSHAGEGIAMTVDIKIPILGTATSRSYVYGSKFRVEMKMMGVQFSNMKGLPKGPVVVAGTLGRSPLVDELVRTGLVDVKNKNYSAFCGILLIFRP